jgi:hypothetical protein
MAEGMTCGTCGAPAHDPTVDCLDAVLPILDALRSERDSLRAEVAAVTTRALTAEASLRATRDAGEALAKVARASVATHGDLCVSESCSVKPDATAALARWATTTKGA